MSVNTVVVDVVEGNNASPVLLHVPHAGREVPHWVRERLLIDDDELAAEQAALTDHHTDLIATAAADAARLRPFLLVNPMSRFVVDVERFPDEREEMAAVGMAAVYTHGTRRQRIRATDPEHEAALLAAFYEPWAAAAREAVDDRLAATGRAVLIDVHSYTTEPLPHELHADGPRHDICLGVDATHTPPWLVAAAEQAFAPLGEVGVNSPFAGAYVPMAHYGIDLRVAAIMIELRRDVYLGDPTGPVAAALAALVDAVT